MYTILFRKILLSGKTAYNFETLGNIYEFPALKFMTFSEKIYPCQAGLLSAALVLSDPFCQLLYYLKGTVSNCILTYTTFFFLRMGMQPHLVFTNLTIALAAFLLFLPSG